MSKPILRMVLFALCSSQALAKITVPTRVAKSTVIELTDDLVIDTKTSPIIAELTFGSKGPEKVVFTSKTKKSVIVAKNGIWDLSSFNSRNKIIEFRGNAQLVCEPGAKIIFNNGLLRFSEATKWIIS